MKSQYLLPLNTTVYLESKRTGKVVGYGTLLDEPTRQVYLVKLTEGFYSEDGKTFVSVLTVDPSTIMEADEV